jgi:hypothetical protein
MKKFLNVFFVTLGVIFFIILLFISYLFIFDPLNLKPLIFGTTTTTTATTATNKTETAKSSDQNQINSNGSVSFSFSDAQKKTLQSFGIDPASLPTTITVTQQTCLEGKFGTARFAEIKAGASPNAIEFYNAKSCL